MYFETQPYCPILRAFVICALLFYDWITHSCKIYCVHPLLQKSEVTNMNELEYYFSYLAYVRSVQRQIILIRDVHNMIHQTWFKFRAHRSYKRTLADGRARMALALIHFQTSLLVLEYVYGNCIVYKGNNLTFHDQYMLRLDPVNVFKLCNIPVFLPMHGSW